MEEYKFVDNLQELAESTVRFQEQPDKWRKMVGNAPKFFIHTNHKGDHIFGLSKFVAFKGITVEKYIQGFRHKTDGGTTQNHLSWLTGKSWKKLSQIPNNIRLSFEDWILDFFPNYNLSNAHIISIGNGTAPQLTDINKPTTKSKFLSPEQLAKNLEKQTIIGKIGESIAYKYEIERLRRIGIKNPKSCINHIAKTNTAAGYDIETITKEETRYIEVKASINNPSEFYISINEIERMKELVDDSYLYLVNIENIKNKTGQVSKVIKNPINKLKLRPIIYQGTVEE